MPLATEVLVHRPKQIAKPSKFVCSKLRLYEAPEPSGDHREVHRQHVPIVEVIAVWKEAARYVERQYWRTAESDPVVSHRARSASPLRRAVHELYVRGWPRAQTIPERAVGSATQSWTTRSNSPPPRMTTSG